MADTWETDSPETNGISNAGVSVTSDPRGREQLPTGRFTASTGAGTRSNIPSSLVSRTDVTAPSQASTPRKGETVSSWLARERLRTGNSNLQLSRTVDVERALTGNELVWDGNDFVDKNSPTFDPRGRDQLPPVSPSNVQEIPAEQSSSNTANIGYGTGQIDPRLASAAGIGPTIAGSAPVTGPTGSSIGNISAPSSSAGTASPQSFNDRYDFLTKQKVREGEHGGQHGGAGGTRPCASNASSAGGGTNGSGGGLPIGSGGSNGGVGAQATQTSRPPQTALINGQVTQVGFGVGQVDPALARAAGATSVGFGAGQVDPALARAVQQQSSTPSNPKPLPQLARPRTTGPF